jgi:hypothetical protein
LARTPRLRNLVNTQDLKTSLPKTKQAIQKQLLRPTKINPAKAVISFTQPAIIEEENKSPIGPATSRAYLT